MNKTDREQIMNKDIRQFLPHCDFIQEDPAADGTGKVTLRYKRDEWEKLEQKAQIHITMGVMCVEPKITKDYVEFELYCKYPAEWNYGCQDESAKSNDN